MLYEILQNRVVSYYGLILTLCCLSHWFCSKESVPRPSEHLIKMCIALIYLHAFDTARKEIRIHRRVRPVLTDPPNLTKKWSLILTRLYLPDQQGLFANRKGWMSYVQFFVENHNMSHLVSPLCWWCVHQPWRIHSFGARCFTFKFLIVKKQGCKHGFHFCVPRIRNIERFVAQVF